MLDNLLENVANISDNYLIKVSNGFDKTMLLLERNPYIFQKFTQEHFYKNTYRRAIFLKYYIFYSIFNQNVYIISILSCKQDYSQFNF